MIARADTAAPAHPVGRGGPPDLQLEPKRGPFALHCATYEDTDPDAVRLLQPYAADVDREELMRRTHRYCPTMTPGRREDLVKRAWAIVRAFRTDATPGDRPLRPSEIRALMDRYRSEHPDDNTAGGCIQFIAERTGQTLDAVSFYGRYWQRRHQRPAADERGDGEGQQGAEPPAASLRHRPMPGLPAGLVPWHSLQPQVRSRAFGRLVEIIREEPDLSAEEYRDRIGQETGGYYRNAARFAAEWVVPAREEATKPAAPPAPTEPKRHHRPADAVRAWVREQLQGDPTLSATQLVTSAPAELGIGGRDPVRFRARYVTPVRRELGIEYAPGSNNSRRAAGSAPATAAAAGPVLSVTTVAGNPGRLRLTVDVELPATVAASILASIAGALGQS